MEQSPNSQASQHVEAETATPHMVMQVHEDENSNAEADAENGLTPQSSSANSSSLPAELTCVICFAKPREVTLDPCGHDHFCSACAAHFRRCPLCRQKLTTAAGASPPVTQHQLEVSCRRLLTVFASLKDYPAILVILVVMSFHLPFHLVFFSGAWGECAAMETSLGYELEHPRRWFLRGLSSKSSAGMAGISIAVAIAIGMAGRSLLWYGMWADKRPGRLCFTLVFILSAIATLARTLSLDAAYLNHPSSYSIYRTPVVCDAAVDVSSSFKGPDGILYCVDNSSSWMEATVYVATSASRYTPSCTTFTADSAVLELLDGDSWLGQVIQPYPNVVQWRQWPDYHLCDRLSWAISGKFGALQGLAACLNVYADVGVMVMLSKQPGNRATTLCLVSLFLFQLGLLMPATHFSHGDCLNVTNPLGVSLHLVQGAVLALGSSVQLWALAVINLIIVQGVLLGPFFIAYVLVPACSDFLDHHWEKLKWCLLGFVSLVPGLWGVWGVGILLLGCLMGCEALLTCILQWTVQGADPSAVLRGLALAFDILVKFMAVCVLHVLPSRFLDRETLPVHSDTNNAAHHEASATTLGRTSAEDA
mmetsp:Transcript_53441/g.98839  ORF Transcript_53441/g.98839 Transcript_53441/m.98839 type:complete len:592 (-) Transcript_53441:272-2047(-)